MKSIRKILSTKLKTQNAIDKLLQEFKLLTNDEERVKFAMNFFDGDELFEKLQESMKDSKVSVEFMNQGNKLYASPEQSHQLDEIIELYTKSVAYAPDSSQELSIAFANRSAALFNGRLYDECLKDIKRALDLDYPDNLKAKLLARKAQCLVVLDAPAQEVKETVQEARKWLEKMDTNNHGRKMIETILDNPIMKRDFPEQRGLLDDERNLPAILSENPQVEGLSSAVEVKYSEKFGKHVVATKNIEPGEVIGIEKSYASVLEKEMLYTNCSNCLKRTWSGIPCNFCPEVIYCSGKCQEEAWEDHHDMECQLLRCKIHDIENVTTQPHIFLGLRLCVRALKEAGSIENLREALKKIDSHQVSKTGGFTNDILDNKNFLSIYCLATNADKHDVLFSLFITAIYPYIIQMLTNKNIIMFGKRLDGNLKLLAQDQSVTFIGGLFIRYMLIAVTNAYQIGELFEGITRSRGFGLFPSFSHFKHSCNQNCYTNSFLGRTMKLYTSSFIKNGKQIFVSYGPEFAFREKAKRQEHLMSFCFNCKCKACTNDWPVMDKLPLLNDLELPAEIKLQALDYMKLCQEYANIINYDIRLIDSKKMIKDLGEIIKYLLKNVPMLFKEFTWIRLMLGLVIRHQGNCSQTLNQLE